MSALHGRIIYRLNLPDSSSDVPLSKPDHSNIKSKKNSASSLSLSLSSSRNSEQHEQYYLQCGGYIFVENTDTDHHNEFLLSLPEALVKVACEAVRTEREVVIRRYTAIRQCMIEVHERGLEMIPAHYQESSSTGSHYEECHSSFSRRQKQYFSDRTCNLRNPETRNTKRWDPPERGKLIWTLTQFWRKERIDYPSMNKSRPSFSIIATIDAISPVIAMDPSNPFALIEAYDKDNTDVCCVIVLRGNALLNHGAIFPRDTLVFSDVVYKPWSVPHVLNGDNKQGKRSSASIPYRHLIERIPSHVFVANKVDNIFWRHLHHDLYQRNENSCEQTNSTFQQHQHSIDDSFRNTCSSIITPVNLITTVRGRIYHTKKISIPSGTTKAIIFHYVDMTIVSTNDFNSASGDGGDDDKPRCRLYLSYFPMSVDIQLSLREGAVIQAYNVHLVHSQNDNDVKETIQVSYGACLRSSLVLIKNASDTSESVSSYDMQREEDQGAFMNDNNMKHNYSSISDHKICVHSSADSLLPFLHYGFRRIGQTYLKDFYSEKVDLWMNGSFREGNQYLNDNKKFLEDFIINYITKFDNNNNNTHGINETESHCYNCEVQSGATKILKRHPLRSPYAEFFDHPFTFNTSHDDRRKSECGCHLSSEDRNYSSFSNTLLLNLKSIRKTSQRFFVKMIRQIPTASLDSKVTILYPVNQLKMGFNCSIRVPMCEFYNIGATDEDHQCNEKSPRNYNCLAGGFVSELHRNPIHGISSVVDGEYQIPVSFDPKCDYEDADINDFIMGQLDYVTISCLCIGSSSSTISLTKSKNHNISRNLPIPVLEQGEVDLASNCSFVTVGGLLFMTAIQIHFRNYNIFKAAESSPKNRGDTKTDEICLSIQKVLMNEDIVSKSINSSSTMAGILTRCRFHYNVNVNGTYKCYNAVVSSFNETDKLKNLSTDNSCLQSIELSLSIAQNTARMIKFNQTLDCFLPDASILQSQKVLGLSFWILAGSGRTCALTFGGNEDIIHQGSSCSKSFTKLYFPVSSLKLTKLGYVRSSCTHNQLDVVLKSSSSVNHEQQSRDYLKNFNGYLTFNTVGGTKKTNGMLHRKPYRRNIFRSFPSSRVVGELTVEPSIAIPVCTVSYLFDLVIRCLRDPGAAPRIMNPSLVRRIPDGRFLNVLFCQASCYCMRCFCSLVKSTVNTRDNGSISGKSTQTKASGEPSFWNRPRPDNRSDNINQNNTCYTSFRDNDEQLSSFRCPRNDCTEQAFGIKWECSGILDDGTGQATMYADGDVALTLLGIPVENIQMIERGVWSTRDGILLYMKSMPPSNELQQNLRYVLSTGKRNNRMENASTCDPLLMLSAVDRAKYLLERHCRSSKRPRRLLDYYVRCKPLKIKSNTIPHILHSTVGSFFVDKGGYCNGGGRTIFRGQVASYTLPTLRLELVDCGATSK